MKEKSKIVVMYNNGNKRSGHQVFTEDLTPPRIPFPLEDQDKIYYNREDFTKEVFHYLIINETVLPDKDIEMSIFVDKPNEPIRIKIEDKKGNKPKRELSLTDSDE
jgi:hypothetical protein